MSRLRSLAEIESKGIDWLWFPYIPKGKITMICSNPDVGKSWLTLGIARAVASGNWDGLPNTSPTQPANVLLMSDEDGPEDTIKPRLSDLGPEVLERILVEEEIKQLDWKTGFKRLDGLIQDCKPSLVVIDPLSSYLPSRTNTNNPSHMRRTMKALKDLASKHNCAIIIVRHFNKQREVQSLITRASGSQEIVAACRSAFAVIKHGEDASTLFQFKCNLAKKGPPISFQYKDGKFTWLGVSRLTLEQLLATDSGESRVQDGIHFLERELADGSQPPAKLIHKFESQGGSRSTLYRSREAMGVSSVDVPLPSRASETETHWKLPAGYDFRHLQRGSTGPHQAGTSRFARNPMSQSSLHSRKSQSQQVETETETQDYSSQISISNGVSSREKSTQLTSWQEDECDLTRYY